MAGFVLHRARNSRPGPWPKRKIHAEGLEGNFNLRVVDASLADRVRYERADPPKGDGQYFLIERPSADPVYSGFPHDLTIHFYSSFGSLRVRRCAGSRDPPEIAGICHSAAGRQGSSGQPVPRQGIVPGAGSHYLTALPIHHSGSEWTLSGAGAQGISNPGSRH